MTSQPMTDATPAETGDALLSVRDLQVLFSLRKRDAIAVQDFSLEIRAGECVGLVGESGCGKTTTGLAVMRLLPINGRIGSGSISLDGIDVANLSEREMRKIRGNKVALIPQDPMSSLNPTMKIGRQIGEGLMIHRGASEADARKRALEVLEMVEMPRPEERLDQYPFELSGGLRQRVIIAMGLVCEPKLLIADEPTTALDVTIQAQILDIIDNLRKSLNMAVLLITHDMGVIAGRTDRVVVMYAGKKAEEAPTNELFTRMHHPYTQALLASMPSLDRDENAELLSIEGMPPDISKPIIGCRFAPRCSKATDQCRAEDPALSGEGTDHLYACFNPVDGPEPVVVPDGGWVRIAAKQSTAETIVVVNDLTKDFPIMGGQLFRHRVGSISAVSHASMTIRAGQTFGLVGESGCGKTTIGRMIVGLETPTSGQILFEDNDVTFLKGSQARASRRDRQMMFQDPYSSLNPRMRVEEVIGEPLDIHKTGTKAERNARVGDLLEAVGLSRQAGYRYPHEFSGGQRQRIGLARALALNPKLIVADEPVSALDVSVQAQILNLMKELQRQHHMSYVFISHDLAVVYYMADVIGVMYLGKIVEIGDAESVFRTPAHPYTEGLLDAVPIPDPAKAGSRTGIVVKGELPSAANPPSGCRFRTRCPKAQDLCAEQEPPFMDYGPTQRAACHFPLKTPVTLTPRS